MVQKYWTSLPEQGNRLLHLQKKGYDVIGIDLSEAMLKVAIKKN